MLPRAPSPCGFPLGGSSRGTVASGALGAEVEAPKVGRRPSGRQMVGRQRLVMLTTSNEWTSPRGGIAVRDWVLVAYDGSSQNLAVSGACGVEMWAIETRNVLESGRSNGERPLTRVRNLWVWVLWAFYGGGRGHDNYTARFRARRDVYRRACVAFCGKHYRFKARACEHKVTAKSAITPK